MEHASGRYAATLIPIPIHQYLYALTHTYTPTPICHAPTLYLYTNTYMLYPYLYTNTYTPRSYLLHIHQYLNATPLPYTYTPIHICLSPTFNVYTNTYMLLPIHKHLWFKWHITGLFFKLSTNVSTKLP